MRVAVDIDDTLIGYTEFMDANYKAWADKYNLDCNDTPVKGCYDDLERYGVDIDRNSELVDRYLNECRILDEGVKFILTLQKMGLDPFLLTARTKSQATQTRRQLAPLYNRAGLLHTVFTGHSAKTSYMQRWGAVLMIDDAPHVIQEVKAVDGLSIISPVRDFNQGHDINYFTSFDEALTLVEKMCKQYI